jgi:hypothetical protein
VVIVCATLARSPVGLGNHSIAVSVANLDASLFIVILVAGSSRSAVDRRLGRLRHVASAASSSASLALSSVCPIGKSCIMQSMSLRSQGVLRAVSL